MPAPGETSESREQRQAKVKVSRMVMVVVMVFALCWLPTQMLYLLGTVGALKGDNVDPLDQVIIITSFNLLAVLNSCVNPILYAFLSRSFREKFFKLRCLQHIPS